jgi:hypothetical protein
MKNHKTPLCSGYEGYKALELVTACMISAKQKKKKLIPLKNEDYIIRSR